MKKQVIFKEALRVYGNANAAAQYGYEMGCLISAEFCPYPEVSDTINPVREFIEKYGFGIVDFAAWLHERMQLWKGFDTPVEYDIWCEVQQYLEELEETHESKLH